jgi:hypothetical protein
MLFNILYGLVAIQFLFIFVKNIKTSKTGSDVIFSILIFIEHMLFMYLVIRRWINGLSKTLVKNLSGHIR